MKNFIKVLTDDPKVRDEFIRQDTPEGAYEVAKPYISNMTLDEFTVKLSELGHAIEELQSNELSDEELNAVSGGGKFGDQMKKWGSQFTKLAYQYGPTICAALGSFLSSKQSTNQSNTPVEMSDLNQN